MPQPDQMKREDANRLCRAASAVYYEIVCASAKRTGTPAKLPFLLCPKGRTPCTCEFSHSELEEAEAFLLRLGVIGER